MNMIWTFQLPRPKGFGFTTFQRFRQPRLTHSLYLYSFPSITVACWACSRSPPSSAGYQEPNLTKMHTSMFRNSPYLLNFTLEKNTIDFDFDWKLYSEICFRLILTLIIQFCILLLCSQTVHLRPFSCVIRWWLPLQAKLILWCHSAKLLLNSRKF